jgi:hypothetical protein
MGGSETNVCNWLRSKIRDINFEDPSVYDYGLVRDLFRWIKERKWN